MGYRVTVVIPVRDEAGRPLPLCHRIHALIPDAEILLIADSEDDDTAWPSCAERLVQDYGPGPARAIIYGIHHAAAPVVAVMCGDGSDDPGILPALVDLVEAGNVVACASRYLPGGARTGGPRVKAFLSRLAGRLFPGVTDPTSAYKAYSADFLTAAWPQASAGFEMGIEMCAKADRMGLPVAEVPVVWAERTSGSSHFRWRWVPAYARWLLYAHTGR